MEMQGRGEGQEDQQNPRPVNPPETQMPRHQPPPPQRCPRCDSVNTKFCYYNNYSLSQPRYFCKACRRYWTHGGTLRNVPVGGGCRKSKRSKASSSSSSGSERAGTQPLIPALPSQNLMNLAGGISGNSGLLPGTHSVRALPSMGSFYSGGEFLSTLAAMQSQNQPPRINQAPLNLGGGHNFGGVANTVLLQGLNLPQEQIQAQNETLSSQQQMVLPRPLGSWTQNLINSNTAASVSNPNFWNTTTAGTTTNSGRTGPSINPSQWSDNLPRYNPTQ